ncbi:hypothetical protein KEM60_02820 [Austwickia sp. TVS 96-490-7B]|uniref:PadR family transcriptional regulator n=1 Tax=Austwickia sp. TVS 96-490-7B TaxID=2830843 RepID=UPI001C59C00A|nr:PadR family transcriptional regulator [Austwickia sp. TVS 96-490-7B]MBW3086592.1 hypothetical protein [Austwickia sp. TVS 96-490-7B]
MSTSHALLGLLETAPAHGYTLKHRYDDLFGRGRPLAFGQVYASLSRFEKQGWAEVIDVESGQGPDRKRYHITPDGVAVLDTWVQTPPPPGLFTTSALFARISVALLSGRDAGQVLDRQRADHLTRMRTLTAARRTADPATDLSLSYELIHLDADLRWIDEAGRRLGEVRADLESRSRS